MKKKMEPNKDEKKKPDSSAEKGIIDELNELRKSMADIQALLMKSAEDRKKAQDTKEKEEKDDGELKY